MNIDDCKNKEIILSEEKIKKIKNFSVEAAPYHYNKNNKRTSQEIEHNIYTGKMGEEVWREAHYFLNLSPISYEIHKDGKGDGGIDIFIGEKYGVDIKTVDSTNKTYRYIGSTTANFYGFVQLNASLNGGICVGTIEHNDLIKYAEYDKEIEKNYVHKRVFEGLNSTITF